MFTKSHDFFIWPPLKNPIYETSIVDVGDLKERLIDKIEEINNIPEILNTKIRKFVCLTFKIKKFK